MIHEYQHSIYHFMHKNKMQINNFFQPLNLHIFKMKSKNFCLFLSVV